MPSKLGEMLVQAKIITPEQLKEALEIQRREGGRLGQHLMKLGYVTEEQITQILSRQYGVPSVNLSKLEIDPEITNLVPVDVCQKYMVMPIRRVGATLTIAMVDPTNVFALDDIKFMTGLNVEPVVATEEGIKKAIEKYYGASWDEKLKTVLGDMEGTAEEIEVKAEEEEIDIAELEKSSEDAPVVRLVNLILSEAVQRGASDIHIEPYEKDYRIRFRIDGVLYEVMSPPLKLKDAVASRIKILSQLDISEKRLPQDGRIKVRMKTKTGTKDLDIRVSVLPTLFGEKIVMRLLDKDQLRLDMTQLGFEPSSLEKFLKAISKPYGMVLVTGPTGSGKTNTLYSALSRLNTPEVNIMTAEDPVEFNLHGINQVQMHERIGLNFATALRSFLRQDPNIIMVGEIRDFETAEIAIKAALTGHLVLSTLHTNDAPSSVSRLLNMGIEPFLVSTSLLLVVAQRLVRRICPQCKQPITYPPEALIDVGFSPDEIPNLRLYKGAGCPNCNNTGYRGRIGVFEVMEVSDTIREMILEGASTLELKHQAREEGMITLRESGLIKVRQGITTIEEVLRETAK
ncbi:MAG: type IV-A pilus assembly ATPase PilB [Acidobacteria bacterium]|nr:type IV-A pilus assembly ATPase PilB [Acidobacteriota bacterium]